MTNLWYWYNRLAELSIRSMEILWYKIDQLFANVESGETLKSDDTMADLSNHSVLYQYLNYAQEHICFVSFKKCGSINSKIWKPPRLNDQDFKCLDHLLDPTSGTTDHHYRQFSELFGADTTEEAIHASNTGLTIDCVGCSKPQLVCSAKKFMESEKKLFNCVMSDMIYTSGTMIAELKNHASSNNRCYDTLNKCSVRANNACAKSVEPLYYTCNYTDCCCHCASKWRLLISQIIDITGIQCLHSAKY